MTGKFINGYIVENIFDNTYGISEPNGDNYMYLISGDNKALLIDTGLGIGDLKGVVDALTGGKEYYVANTHGHIDHVCGNYQFSDVWIHPDDEAIMRENYTKEELTEWLLHADYDWIVNAQYQPGYREKLLECTPSFRVHHIEDGMEFDLGGTVIEAIHVPGHTVGHACFLDKTNRRLFVGDSVMRHTFISNGGGAPIEVFLDSLMKVYDRRDEFDNILAAHGHEPVFRMLQSEHVAKLIRCVRQFDFEKAESMLSETGIPSYRFMLDDIPYEDPESISVTVSVEQWEEYTHEKEL